MISNFVFFRSIGIPGYHSKEIADKTFFRYNELTYRPIQDGEVESVLVGNELPGYYAYPIAYVVPRDYCQPKV